MENNNLPKVSVIVPIYNVEKYLERCMDTLVNQTLKDIEIIMVDDGSPDNCPKLCDEWAKKDSRIKVVHKKNGGLGDARNAGLDVATGKYVAFVDSDDFVSKEMYENLYNEAVNTGADTVFCGNYQYSHGKSTEGRRNLTERKTFKGNSLKDFCLDFVASPIDVKTDWKYEMSVWHGIYSNEIIQEYNIRFRSEREVLSEDIYFNQLYLVHTKKVSYLPEAYYYYCDNNNESLTHAKYDSSCYTRMLTLYQGLCDLTIERDPHCMRAKRCLIAYMRGNAYKIIDAHFNHSDTVHYLKELDDKNVWKKIDYPIKTLEFHSFIIAYLQKHGLENFLILFLKLVEWAKQMGNK